MTKVTIIKASPIGDQQIPDTTIYLRGEPPDMGLKESRHWFDGEAKRLYDALCLPGGTMDALLRLLLLKRASLLRISWFSDKKE